ncbi:2-amino-4-hydroxy-6-hydroxymethyldihydropteridine diphosphokinase [Buchananella hordeovulneris]|uniref:2-amino-4-hydroxy-6- hydroxymethyldihydropteridine diphosphokinase n=1 Tax=Buchananella hordeovulneris TaxID=52770 RepID=UPI0026DCA858|nr:2-amino-4-hydroxy-6-hydroxymethyldihydropteridine diphosphokinase [Buchananella hordeovulneris]MDO5081323.1 2-amino-4-hydroxy-6-hydroxymethyldihydropteridine diphosphokinase [Buchananella hordeovulneris]
MTDRITLTGLSAHGYHGVLEQEREEGQTFTADVVLEVDSRAAAGSDDIAAAVSYAEVAERVVAVLAGSPVNLIETLAARIAAVVLADERVQAVEVTVHKPQAPLNVPFGDVSVTIRRPLEAPAATALPTAGDQLAEKAPAAQAEGGGTGAEEPAPSRAPAAASTVWPAPEAAPAPASLYEAAAASPAAPFDNSPALRSMVLSLGANLGDTVATLDAAVADIADLEGVQVIGVSPLVVTAPVLEYGQAPQDDYRNIVVTGTTTLAPLALLDALQEVEEWYGRERRDRWGPRTLDIDIIELGGLQQSNERLTLPHPRAHSRAFVLYPWALLDPSAHLAGISASVSHLADTASDRGGVREVHDRWRSLRSAAAVEEEPGGQPALAGQSVANEAQAQSPERPSPSEPAPGYDESAAMPPSYAPSGSPSSETEDDWEEPAAPDPAVAAGEPDQVLPAVAADESGSSAPAAPVPTSEPPVLTDRPSFRTAAEYADAAQSAASQFDDEVEDFSFAAVDAATPSYQSAGQGAGSFAPAAAEEEPDAYGHQPESPTGSELPAVVEPVSADQVTQDADEHHYVEVKANTPSVVELPPTGHWPEGLVKAPDTSAVPGQGGALRDADLEVADIQPPDYEDMPPSYAPTGRVMTAAPAPAVSPLAEPPVPPQVAEEAAGWGDDAPQEDGVAAPIEEDWAPAAEAAEPSPVPAAPVTPPPSAAAQEAEQAGEGQAPQPPSSPTEQPGTQQGDGWAETPSWDDVIGGRN